MGDEAHQFERGSMRSLVCGAGGFIGGHMVEALKARGHWVRGVDLVPPAFSTSQADEFLCLDLRRHELVQQALSLPDGQFDRVFQFAADMGGAGYIFTGEHDADVMHNSAQINLNVLDCVAHSPNPTATRIFYSSSACIYPEYNQLDPDNPICSEESAYPANPDSEYGWEKLFSERLYASYYRNYGIAVRVARYHNIFGPLGTWQGGKEKAPAAICRKIAMLPLSGGEIDVWGDGHQTRSFLYIDDCIEATLRLMESDYLGPVNIGSEEMVTINQLVEIVSNVANKPVSIRHILDAPLGVRGRNSDNRLIRSVLNWDYSFSLHEGISRTYQWINTQLKGIQ